MSDAEFEAFANYVEGSPAPAVDEEESIASDADVDAGTMDVEIVEDVADEEEEVSDDDEEEEEEEIDSDEDIDTDIDIDTEEEEESEELTPDQIIESLRAQLAAVQTVTPETPVKTEGKTTDTTQDVADEAIPDFVTEENFDEILEDPKKMNEIIYKAVQAGVASQMKAIQTSAVEAVQLSVPNMVASQVAQQNAINESVNQFYSEHKVLSAYKPVVAANINAVAAENPEWPLDKIMPEAASRSYTQLHLNKRANEAVSNGDAKSTGLRKGGRKRKSSARGKKVDARTELQKEMDALDFKN